ncbi:GTP binding protein yptV4 [Trichuris trichiura]|uniref:GTP binding protein yptV4 n=1 Tax=Trichuris trichiura TaxID=36087 RepID=A0A077YXK5_TRITR|nr:GTP binding protein yptV4 [Trichuris trichiura]
MARRCSGHGMESNELFTSLMVMYFALVFESSFGQVIPGGLRPANVDNEKLEKMANIGINFLNKNFQDNQLLKLLRVEDAQAQTAQGRVYHLKLNVASTNCTKDTKKDEQNNCEETEESGRKLCSVKVWEWRGKLKATKGSCEDIIEPSLQTTEQSIEATISDLTKTAQANTTAEIPSEGAMISTN